MSLNYDLRKIEDKEWMNRPGNPAWGEDAEGNYWNTEAQNIIFATMAVGMGTITEANYVKFYTRYQAWSTAIDPRATEYGITLAGVRKMIGLSTNVFPMVTDAAFNKIVVAKLWATMHERVDREARDIQVAEHRATNKAKRDAPPSV